MDHAGSLLPNVLRKRGLYDEAYASMIVHRARRWIAERCPEHAAALSQQRLQDGVLSIAAGNANAQQELTLCAAELLAYLQAEDNGGGVREVRCVRR